MVDAKKETFELAMPDAYPVLFTSARVDRKTVPKDLFCYDVRHDDDCQGIACEIKPYVAVNHWGTILTRTEIPMAEGGRYYPKEDMNYFGETLTVEEYMRLGLQMTNEGKLIRVEAATSITEVERRTRSLVSELQKRHIHYDVIKCCKEEYLQENYFHAVFEAAKSLSEKVREKTGILDDGTSLFNTAFSVNNPRLAINSLQTSSERNIQNGLKEMLNGVTHMVRNVTAHELKIKWVVNEQEAIDILTTISFLHKQLDECFVVPQQII